MSRRLISVTTRPRATQPEHGTGWTVWSDALVMPVAYGTEEHCKRVIREKLVVIRGVPEQVLRSPAGDWYRWDGAEWVPDPEGGAVPWCDTDDCPAVACPQIPGSCSAPAGLQP